MRIGIAGLAAALLLGGCGAMETRQSAADADANRPSLITARSALAQGQASTALSIAGGVLASEPRNKAALVAAGDAELALGSRLNAEREYRHALQVDPGYVPALIGNAKLKLKLEPVDPKGAEADLRAVLARDPRNTAALTDLGVALDMQLRHREAQGAYARALEINPDLSAPRVNLALSLALSGDAPKAEQMLRDAVESGPVPARVRANFALAQVLAGHPEDAEKTLQSDLSVEEARASVEGMKALAPAPAAKTK